MTLEMSSDSAVCTKCGIKYGARKGNFMVSYATAHKGTGHMPICKSCVEKLYNAYFDQCKDTKKTVRQMCRKLDLYWSDEVYAQATKKSNTRSVFSHYVTRLNTASYVGRSFDDTLKEEGTLWVLFPDDEAPDPDSKAEPKPDEIIVKAEGNMEDITDKVVAFWGTGYTAQMYLELEQRRKYWMSRLPEGAEIDIGTEALIRQICNLEINIAKDSANGRSIEKSVNALNTLLGSLNLKPAQKKNDQPSSLESMPFGVLIKERENHRPVGDTTEDEDDIARNVLTWLYGHLTKMFGEKNAHSKLYDAALEKYRVERPEYDDEDDDEFLYQIFSSEEDQDDFDSFESDRGGDTS